MDTLLKDIRFGLRSLLKRPGFFVVALLTLALGIGATCAMFNVVNSVLLKPLSYPESERIVIFRGANPSQGITMSNLSGPDINDWQKQTQSFEQITAFSAGGALLTAGDETERVRAAGVTKEFFPLFRTNPVLGRTLQDDDQEQNREAVALLSYGLWQRRFGGDAGVINSKITVAGKPTTIVGVMPAGFDYPSQSEMWLPLSLNLANEERDNRYLTVVTRLKQGVSIESAQAEMNTISQRLAESFRDSNAGWGVNLYELRESLVGQQRTSLLLLLGAVAFVLLIACANVANLLLARSIDRQKEIALRTALGASRSRIVRQLLTESLLLSILSGIIGLGVSVWLTKMLIAVSPANSPRFDEIRLDYRVFLFAFSLTVLTGIVFGLLPALQTSRPNLNSTLKEGGRQGSASVTRNRLGSLVMVSEIALSFVLLVGAGLLIKSFLQLQKIDPGFNPENVLTLRLTLPSGKYQQGEPRAQIYRQLVDRVKSVPGVITAGSVLSLPLGGDSFNVGRGLIPDGRPITPEEAVNARYLPISPEYFQVVQIPLKAGRAFDQSDHGDSTKVIIINESLARRVWPGENPIGKRVSLWRDEKYQREIVGIVGDTKGSLDEPAALQTYVPYAQDATWGSLSLAIRTSGDPSSVTASVREAIRSVDKGIPLYNVKTMSDVVATSVAPRRTPMLLLTAFAGVAMLLAMIGIYGIASYYVVQRTKEIGVRIALGAQVADVLKLVLGRGMFLASVGIAIGIGAAVALTRFMRTLLFEVAPFDLFTLGVVAFVLGGVALLACYIPARRATRVDPLVALRNE